MSDKRMGQELLFQAASRKLKAGAALQGQDIEVILKGVLDGRWISGRMLQDMQAWLAKIQAPSRPLAAAINGFLALRYHDYLLRTRIQSAARSPAVPYRLDHILKTTAHNRRPGLNMHPLYLTIHSTGNPSSSTKGERAWLTNPTNDRTASFHVVVDEKEAIECIPLNEVAWHAGDGNGNGNKKSISLEICESGDRAATLRNAIILSAKLLRDNNMTAESLRRHHDWATKLCPRILIVPQNRAKPEHTWEWFKAEVAQLI